MRGILGFFALGLAQVRPPLNYYQRAQTYTHQGKWDSALVLWRLLWNRERDSIRQALITQQMGYIALRRGDSLDALKLWELSLRYRPDYAIAEANYRWLRAKLRVPPPAPLKPLYQPPLRISENAPPHLGQAPPLPLPPVRWLPAARLLKK
ncbi:MAG: hypothetical protein NZ958_04980 [Bacteroidia bacterium]|nr:hypothetical protein [Bacteroidia bacterium]MDW8089389.1 hypothetical protein [Bacteroidia bacterium]